MKVILVEQRDVRLGRQIVHDPRSRAYEHEPRATTIPNRPWRHRIYSPSPLPNQEIGCCSGVDQAIKCNAAGNRVAGAVLGMADAESIYSRATQLDPWPGQYPPTDTGSSGLAACKAAKEKGLIERYEWIFTGVEGVLQALVSKPVGVGTMWTEDMFNPDPAKRYLVRPTGATAGGHQWTLIGYNPFTYLFDGMCWWGPTFGQGGVFRIHRDDLAALLTDNGDAHATYRATRPGLAQHENDPR